MMNLAMYSCEKHGYFGYLKCDSCSESLRNSLYTLKNDNSTTVFECCGITYPSSGMLCIKCDEPIIQSKTHKLVDGKSKTLLNYDDDNMPTIRLISNTDLITLLISSLTKQDALNKSLMHMFSCISTKLVLNKSYDTAILSSKMVNQILNKPGKSIHLLSKQIASLLDGYKLEYVPLLRLISYLKPYFMCVADLTKVEENLNNTRIYDYKYLADLLNDSLPKLLLDEYHETTTETNTNKINNEHNTTTDTSLDFYDKPCKIYWKPIYINPEPHTESNTVETKHEPINLVPEPHTESNTVETKPDNTINEKNETTWKRFETPIRIDEHSNEMYKLLEDDLNKKAHDASVDDECNKLLKVHFNSVLYNVKTNEPTTETPVTNTLPSTTLPSTTNTLPSTTLLDNKKVEEWYYSNLLNRDGYKAYVDYRWNGVGINEFGISLGKSPMFRKHSDEFEPFNKNVDISSGTQCAKFVYYCNLLNEKGVNKYIRYRIDEKEIKYRTLDSFYNFMDHEELIKSFSGDTSLFKNPSGFVAYGS